MPSPQESPLFTLPPNNDKRLRLSYPLPVNQPAEGVHGDRPLPSLPALDLPGLKISVPDNSLGLVAMAMRPGAEDVLLFEDHRGSIFSDSEDDLDGGYKHDDPDDSDPNAGSSPDIPLSEIPKGMSYKDWLVSVSQKNFSLKPDNLSKSSGEVPTSRYDVTDALPSSPKAPRLGPSSGQSPPSKELIKKTPSAGVTATTKARKLHKNPARAVTKDAVVPKAGAPPRKKAVCEECNKLMLQKNLPRHIASKHNGVRHSCPFCKDQLKFKGDVKRHIRSHHPFAVQCSTDLHPTKGPDIVHKTSASMQ